MVFLAPAAETILWRQTAVTPIDSIVLDDVKTFIHRPLEDTFWDGETTNFIRVAQRAIETHCQLSLATATWVGTMSRFHPQFRINKRPFLDVEAIRYIDATTGNVETVDPETYQVARIGQMCGMVTIGEGLEWPDAARRLNAISVTITTGFVGLDGITPELPFEIKQALNMTVAELDTARGDSAQGGGGGHTVYELRQQRNGYLNPSIRDLLAPFTYQQIAVA